MKNTKYKVISSNNDDDIEDYMPNIKQQHLPFFEQQKTQVFTKLSIYLDENIKEVSYYRPILERLRSLEEGDMVEITVYSPGGSVQSAISLINAIQSCEADVLCIIDNYAGSAASLIALACPNIGVAPNSTIMIHNYSMGSFGKGSDIVTHVNYTDNSVKKLMTEVYEGFLTAKELDELFIGKDFYFDTQEIEQRLVKRNTYFEKKLKPKKLTKPKQRIETCVNILD